MIIMPLWVFWVLFGFTLIGIFTFIVIVMKFTIFCMSK